MMTYNMYKTAAPGVLVPTYKTVGKKLLNGILDHPYLTSGAIGAAGTGIGVGLANKQNQEAAEAMQNMVPEDDPTAPERRNINMGAAAGAGALGAVGLYHTLNAIPVLRRYKLLRALMAVAGGGAMGYGAWKMADNYQINSK